jgi:hypothetical protein
VDPFRSGPNDRQYNVCASTQGPLHAQQSLDIAADHDHIGLTALAYSVDPRDFFRPLRRLPPAIASLSPPRCGSNQFVDIA